MIQKTILVKAAAAVMGTAVIAGAAAAVNHMLKPKNSYRSILLYEIEGTAKIERQGTGTLNGVENLHLESGDELTVGEESFTRLRLDDDKYVMVEENSALSIEAAGGREDSRTSIHLTKGAIINEIQNPLSAGSMYEVTTPNSVMAVRGTIFRVEIYYDENGEMCTRVSVFNGEVASRLIYPDGTMDEEAVTGSGHEVIIHSNADLTEYLGESREIDYETLPLGTLYLIREMMDQGSSVGGITREELAEYILEKEGAGDKADSDGKDAAGESQASDGDRENREPESSGPADSANQTEAADRNEPEGSPVRETQRESRPGRGEESLPETTGAAESLEEQAGETTAAPSETETSASGNERRGISHRHSSSGGSGGSGGSGSGSSGGSLWQRPTQAPTEAPTESAEYTVTFKYNGNTFGTQQVKEGQCATEPWLNPSSSGSWDYDFKNPSPITADTTIYWQK